MNDLSALSKTGSADRADTLVAGQKNNVAIAGGQILGDEWSDHVVKVGCLFLHSSEVDLLIVSFPIIESFGYHLERKVRAYCFR